MRLPPLAIDSSDNMTLSVSDKLGPYEILAPIGKGGMGEVYRARDTRLNREVAVKVSAERFTERFEREARAIATLNHSNICHLYDVGSNYLVMEFKATEQAQAPTQINVVLNWFEELKDRVPTK